MRVLTAVLMFVVLISGCSDEGADKTQGGLEVRKGEGEKQIARKAPGKVVNNISEEGTLRAIIPRNALAYIRIPNFWGFMSSPKGDTFHEALNRSEHLDKIQDLQAAFYKKIIRGTPGIENPYYSFYLYNIRSPIEAVIIPSDTSSSPIPNIVASVKINSKTVEEAEQLIRTLVDASPALSMNTSLSSDGYGAIISPPFMIYLHFDTSKQRLGLMSGPGLTEDIFKKTLGMLKPVNDHPMYLMEKKIDASHHGFFKWINFGNLISKLEGAVPPEKLAMFKASPFAKAKALGIGWGVSEGKGRLKLMVDIPDFEFSKYIPKAKNEYAVQASGSPGVVASIKLPGPNEFKEFEKTLQAEMTPENHKKYLSAKSRFSEYTGVTIEEILAAIGHELIFFNDKLGEYSAIKVRNRESLQSIFRKFVENMGGRYETREINGKTIHHLAIPSIMKQASVNAGKDNADVNIESKNIFPLLSFLTRSDDHAYWLYEGDYMVVAKVPQLLIDRIQYKDKIYIKEWMENTQRHDASASLFMASIAVPDSPRRLYYFYLQLLNFLGDITGEYMDLFDMPTAQQLQFPEMGAYGIKIDADQSMLSAELMFESNPLEIVLNQDMTSIAVVGILAAIAIPAYQEYTIRAAVAEGLASASPMKTYIAEHYRKHRKFPGSVEVSKLQSLNKLTKYISSIEAVPDSGVVVITFANNAVINNQRVSLIPIVENQVVGWQCQSELKAKHLPSICRENATGK